MLTATVTSPPGLEFSGNTASGYNAQASGTDGGSAEGGAPYAVSSALTLSHCEFSNNAAAGGSAAADAGGDSSGGAVYADSCSVSIGATAFTGNTAIGGSGGTSVWLGYGSNAFGGAVYLRASSLTLVNSLLVGNSVTGGASTVQGAWERAKGVP